jgi:hypothetical protein
MRQMTVRNFNWFLHTMLFYHTQIVLEKQGKQANSSSDDGNDNSSGGDSSDDSD